MIGAKTRIFALLGNPVDHSLSPAMHNAAFQALGLDAAYVALRCDTADVAPLMRALAFGGGGGNVTVPHKREAAAAAASPNGDSNPSVNTFWAVSGRLVGSDTDRIGIVAAWRSLGAPAGDWLIVGTGGSALAAARAAAIVGASVAVRSRSEERGARFVETLREAGVNPSDRRHVALVINCTPLGLRQDDPLPIDPLLLPPSAVGLDLVYRRGGTEWVRAMIASGHRAVDGRLVLVEQGAASFGLWFPGIDPPTEIMHATVRHALGSAVG